MRVVLAMATFVPDGMGGSETYARGVARALSERADIDLSVLIPSSAFGMFDRAQEMALPTVGGATTRERLTTVARAANPWFTGRRYLANADVVHYPFTVPVPLPRRGRPFVQTVHDVQHHDLPELFTNVDKRYRALVYDRPAKHAGAVITVSEFCKMRIVARLGVDPDRIAVAHLGVDTQKFQPYVGPRESFVLYPARVWPHKNHKRLIDAVALLRRTLPGLRLVLTGGGAAQLEALPPWVEHRGLVSEEELQRLYRSAACLAFPSLYEGFGLPVLEAMACGCPVAASDRGSLPEVCGDAAVMFDPEDVHDMARALLTAIEAQENLAFRGLRRAELFAWRDCAEVHAAVYRRLVGE
jgi:glycosyltransferase involved in cell wall biosynthesis